MTRAMNLPNEDRSAAPFGEARSPHRFRSSRKRGPRSFESRLRRSGKLHVHTNSSIPSTFFTSSPIHGTFPEEKADTVCFTSPVRDDFPVFPDAAVSSTPGDFVSIITGDFVSTTPAFNFNLGKNTEHCIDLDSSSSSSAADVTSHTVANVVESSSFLQPGPSADATPHTANKD